MINKGILMILDGYGEGKQGKYNAVANAKTPCINQLKELPHSLLKTDGEAVGLFQGEMGGSEVGHTTIGAGRVVPSTAKKIHDDCISGAFQNLPKLCDAIDDMKKNKSDLHLIGLLSDKNIHSDYHHLLEIMKLASNNANNIYIHVITDGRDSGLHDSLKYLEKLRKQISLTKNCFIASIMGRFYAMDRENNMDRTNLAFSTMFDDKNGIYDADIENYLKNQHSQGKSDEFIEPKHISDCKRFELKDTDYIFFFNFREDRLRQIVNVATKTPCKIITMSNVGGVDSIVLYPSSSVKNTLSEYLSKLQLRQVKISESTKYAHVTYFLNGGIEKAFPLEDRIHVPTIKTDSFVKTPKMRAPEITKSVIKAMKNNYDAIIVNFSNPDMLGHTGDYNATVKSLNCLDKCVAKIKKMAEKEGYFILLTADHGNAEVMMNDDMQPNTSHSLNRVICVPVLTNVRKMKKFGELCDVAPTFLKLMNVEQNPNFEGKSLIVD